VSAERFENWPVHNIYLVYGAEEEYWRQCIWKFACKVYWTITACRKTKW